MTCASVSASLVAVAAAVDTVVAAMPAPLESGCWRISRTAIPQSDCTSCAVGE